MREFNPNDPWIPGHVIMGRSISHHSILAGTSLLILEELMEAGVKQSEMRMRLVRAANISTRAIAKMLVG